MKKFKRIILLMTAAITVFQASAFGMKINYDSNAMKAGESVKRVKVSENAPYIGSRENTTPFYCENENEAIKPVFRLKLNEGRGKTVTEAVSGKTSEIIGSDFEWVENAKIRYGSMTPETYRSNTALKLNTSYINLGKLENLKLDTNQMTIVYWTNYEIKGRNDDYTEPSYHQSLTYGSYKSSYKFEKNIDQLLIRCGNFDLSLNGDKLKFPSLGNGTTWDYDYSVINNDYYNMYYVKIKKVGDVYKAYTSANEQMNMASSKVLGKCTDEILNSLSENDFYIGSSSPDNGERSPQMGLADIMIFDKALDYWELMNIYYGYNQKGYHAANVVQNVD